LDILVYLERICLPCDQNVDLVDIYVDDIVWLVHFPVQGMVDNHYCYLLILSGLLDILVCQEHISFEQDHSVLLLNMEPSRIYHSLWFRLACMLAVVDMKDRLVFWYSQLEDMKYLLQLIDMVV